jgi:DNA-binding protein
MIPFFLVTGACASGKSHYVKILKEEFINENVKVHDFDEKMKLSLEDGVSFFIDTCVNNYNQGYYTVICGGITPKNIINSKKYNSDIKIISCLLNVGDGERERRLRERGQNFFDAVNTLNFTNEQIIKSIVSGASVYKNLIKISHEYIEIDNTVPNNLESSEQLTRWIKKNMRKYEIKRNV